MKKKIIFLIAGVILCVAIGLGIYQYRESHLFGDDKIAYELVYNVADYFEHPETVHIISGTLGENKRTLYCGLSGEQDKEYFNEPKRVHGYFMIGSDGSCSKATEVNMLYKNKNSLNVEKINKELEKNLSSK